MSYHICTKEDFLRDVSKHKIHVKYDCGNLRHICFRSPDSDSRKFTLITWDNNLCIEGDCGTYVFSRVNDMFKFFRANGSLDINPSYWGEKLQSIGTNAGYTEFDPDAFKDAVMDYYSNWLDWCDANDDEKKELFDSIQLSILSRLDEGKDIAYAAISDFENTQGFSFGDFYACDYDTYTPLYIWSLYAIVWGINEYDVSMRSKDVLS